MQYNIRDVKSRFSQLLDLVAQGESVVIVKNGVPVAELVPYRREGIRLVRASETGWSTRWP
jgi:prevent-host-death family protein